MDPASLFVPRELDPREHRRLHVVHFPIVRKSLALPALALLALALALSCASPVAQGDAAQAGPAGTGSLSISVGQAAAKALLLPSIDLTPTVYDISGSGPGGKYFTQSVSSGTAQVPGLSAGAWTVTVSVKNAALQGIGQGSGSVTVQSGATASLAVAVAPLSGNGTVSLTVLLPSGLVAPTISATLAPATGTAIPLSFTLGTLKETCVNTTIPSGYYTLSLKLLESGGLLASTVNALRVVSAATTTASIDLSAVVAPTSPVNVTITQSMNSPITLTLAGGSASLAQGSAMTLTATASPAGGIFSWYLDGSAISPTTASGPTLVVPATLALGPHQLDALVFSSDGLRAGSATLAFVVVVAPVVTPPVVTPPVVTPPVVTPPTTTTASAFTFGVWMQSPTRTRGGLTNAVNCKNIGINAFVGLWLWPTESWAYSGYSLLQANALKASGLKAYAGSDAAAVAWNAANPGFASTFVGYMLGDEADMNKVSGDAATAAAAQPDAWLAAGNVLVNSDPTRARYANFGKGFALDPWNGYHVTTTQAADFAKYVGPTTVFSSDLYGITDPYEAIGTHGIWAYGRAVDNDRKYAGSRPVWGFVEGSAPFGASGYAAGATNYIAQRMTAQYIAPAVWMSVVHGATGIVYFAHDFSSGAVEDGMLAEPGMPAAVNAVDAAVASYSDVLMTPSLTGATAVSSGSVPVTLLVKSYGGSTYVFAMGDGNAANYLGQAVTAQISVPGAAAGTVVQVLSDGRSITLTGSSFSDHFNAYELHIYKF